MEAAWRRAGVLLGKYWLLVLVVVIGVSVVLALGLNRLEFATGQDSYLNSDSQVAIDNVSFQDRFGGETVVLLFRATDDADVTALLDDGNREELERIEADLREVPDVFAVITPRTSVGFSEAIVVEGVGTAALLDASQRETDEAGAAVRQEDLQVTLARLTAIEDQQFSNPLWTDFLIYGNDGFALGDDGVTPPADEDRIVRASLRSTFPSQQVAVGGVVIKGNASLDEQSAATEAVLDIMESVDLDGFEVIPTGSPVYLKEINDYLKGGMLTLGGAAVIIMAIVLLVMFRVRWRLLPLATVLIGVFWGFALLGYLGIDLSLVTISGLPILIGLGIDFAIQVHNRVEEEVVLDRAEHPIAETLANLGPALVAATVAGILAFAALQISQVPMIRDFGIMLAVGIAVLLVTGIALPASWLGIREWTRRTSTRESSIVERIVLKLGSLPAKIGPILIVLSAGLFVAGIALEGQFKIESDPLRWIDQDSEVVDDVETLEDETGFGTTLGILVESNNIFDQDVIDVMHEFTLDAEQRELVVSSSSLVNTLAKIIDIPGATPLAPTSDDLVAARAVLPPDIERALLAPDLTGGQINLRIAGAGLEERAVLVEELEADLERRIAEVDLPAESILLVDLDVGDPAIRAVPSGLAVVGVGLLDNLSANRAILTYLGLAIVALWLIARYRSVTRAVLSLVPVGLAVGVSSVVIALADLTLSPLTTVSGPLVIATCTEFSVLMMARYLEEREHDLEPIEASRQAASRTGRAFFTSAATTIGGFAVLIGSALPLLRDFGIIVTLNVAVALLSALVVMPPLMVWADGRGLMPIEHRSGSVRLAAPIDPKRLAVTGGAFVLVLAAAAGLLAAADRGDGESTEQAFVAVPLPTPEPTPEPTPTPEPEPEEPADGDEPDEPAGPTVDPSTFGSDRPTTLVGGTLFDLLTAQGVEPQVAVCTGETLLTRVTEEELLALGVATLEPAAVELVEEAGLDCGIPQETIDATIEAGL